VEEQELTKLVAMSLDLLPEEYREALTLQIYGGLSYQEIGESMGVPVTTIRNWIVRAKQKMQEILAPYYEEQGL
jgi:RNA polymerase sigma-70 factor (ECF subfamily)